MTTLLGRSGAPVEVPEDEVEASLMAGFRQATPEDLARAGQAQREEQEQGGLAGELTTFAEGAADALTFGAAPWIERALGVKAEDIEARKRINPTARLAGEAAGYIAPAIATLGGSVGVQAAGASARAGMGAARAALEWSAPAVMARIGEGIGGQVLKHLGEGAVGKVAASIANNAAQGALASIGSGVGRFATDHEYTAEALLQDVKFGAAVGGALGGVFSAGTEVALPAALRGAKDLSGAVDGWIDRFMSGAYPKIVEAISHEPERGEVAERIWKLKDLLWTDSVEKKAELETLYDLIDKTKLTGKEINRTIAKDLKPAEFDKLINVQAQAPVVEAQVQDLVERMERAAAEIRAHPGDYYSGAARDLDTFREQLLKDSAEILDKPWGRFHEVFRRIEQTKQNLWELAKPVSDFAPMADKRTAALCKDVWGAAKRGLEDVEVWGEAGARQAALNDAIHGFKNAESALDSTMSNWMPDGHGGKRKVMRAKALERYLNQINDNRGGQQQRIVEDFLESFRALSKEAEKSWQVSKAASYSPKDVEGLIDDVMRAHGLAAERASLTQELRELGQGTGYGANVVKVPSGLPASPVLGAAAGAALAGPVGGAVGAIYGATQLAKDPARMILSMMSLRQANESMLRGIEWAANRSLYGAETAAAKALTAGAIIERFEEQKHTVQGITPDKVSEMLAGTPADEHPVLASALAGAMAVKAQYLQDHLPRGGVGPFGDERPVSSSEMVRFGRIYDAVNEPLSVLRRAAQGEGVSRDEIQAIEATSPRLIQEFRSALIRKIAASPPKDPAVVRNLGLLLGADFTGQASKVRTMQALQPIAAPPPQKLKPMKDISGSMQTSLERSQARSRRID